MGCSNSQHTIKPRSEVIEETANIHNDRLSSRYYSFVEWKLLPSLTQARQKFIDDGTLSNSDENPEYVYLRCLLEDPIGQNALGKFASEIKVVDIFMCWVDIQEFKTIPTENYRFSKGLHIYKTYIKEDALLSLKLLNNIERNLFKHQFTSYLSASFFDKLQHKCFLDMFKYIYIPFKETKVFNEVTESLKNKYNNVRTTHFEYYDKLGEGGFGLVLHCKKKSTRKHYAMKIQPKLSLLSNCRDDFTKVNLEKLACASCQHPFIINLDYAFQTSSLAIMVLDLATAGDLNNSMLSCEDSHMDEDRVRFYAAEMVLALSYLHQMGLIYRDLKPHNVLLQEDGHIKLVDLGGVRNTRINHTYANAVPFLAPSNLKPLTLSKSLYSVGDETAATNYTNSFVDNNTYTTNSDLNSGFTDTNKNYNNKNEEEIMICPDQNQDIILVGRGDVGHKDTNFEVIKENNHNAISNAATTLQQSPATAAIITPSTQSKDNNSPKKEQEKKEEKQSFKHHFSVTGTLGYMAPEMVILLIGKNIPGLTNLSEEDDFDEDGNNKVENIIPLEEKIYTLQRQNQGYTTAVDWWALGATIYKLLTGTRVFSDTTTDEAEFITMSDTTREIINENKNFKEFTKLFKKLNFPSHISDEAKDLMSKLLNVEDELRLGSGDNGIKDIQSHKFFASIDWSLLEVKQVSPPYKPEVLIPSISGGYAENDRGRSDEFRRNLDLESLLIGYGKMSWLKDVPSQKYQKYFDNWNFTSPNTIRVEAGLSANIVYSERKLSSIAERSLHSLSSGSNMNNNSIATNNNNNNNNNNAVSTNTNKENVIENQKYIRASEKVIPNNNNINNNNNNRSSGIIIGGYFGLPKVNKKVL